MARLANHRRSTFQCAGTVARLRIERLEERALLAVFAGAMGGNYSDEYDPIQAGLRNWVEILDASEQADFGPIVTSYSAHDPRSASNFPSHEFNFAVGGADSTSYLGDGAPDYLNSQLGSPTMSGQWGGFRAAALAGDIEYGMLEIGYRDLIAGALNGTLNGPGPFSLAPPDASTTAALNDVIARIAEGLDVATGGAENSVKMVLADLPDLGSAPYVLWDVAGLTAQHRANLRAHVEVFNAELAALAASRSLPVVSLWDWWEDARLGGLTIGSIQIDVANPAPVAVGLEELDHFFLSDGINPTPIAQGLIANRFLDALETHYGETEVSPLSEAELLQLTGLDSTLPMVVDVLVSGTNWGVEPYSIVQNPGELLPLANVDQIEIVFSEVVDVSESDLSLTGVVTSNYGFAGPPTTGPGPSAGEFSALWTLAAPLGTDKLLVQIAGTITDSAGLAIGGQPDHRFDIVPGDANRDGTVGPADYTIWGNEFGTTGAVLDLDQGDFDADGVTGPSEYTTWANHFGQSLPGGEPTAGSASSGPQSLNLLPAVRDEPFISHSPNRADTFGGISWAMFAAVNESHELLDSEFVLKPALVDAAFASASQDGVLRISKEPAIPLATPNESESSRESVPPQRDPQALSLVATSRFPSRDANVQRLWDRAIAEVFGEDEAAQR